MSAELPCVYIIRSGQFLKIGRASKLERRLSTYKTHNPDFDVACFIPSQNPRALEQDLHSRFKKLRRQGEWFADDGEILLYAESIGGQMLEYERRLDAALGRMK
jgi:hypothetical protein